MVNEFGRGVENSQAKGLVMTREQAKILEQTRYRFDPFRIQVKLSTQILLTTRKTKVSKRVGV